MGIFPSGGDKRLSLFSPISFFPAHKTVKFSIPKFIQNFLKCSAKRTSYRFPLELTSHW